MSEVLVVVLAYAVLVCLVALFAWALCVVSATADTREALAESLEREALAEMLDQLSAVRSPGGRRFFSGPGARREFVAAVYPDAAEPPSASLEGITQRKPAVTGHQ